MSSIIKNTTILIISRVINVFVAVLSPILLVRILSVHTYGQYREFVLYTSIAIHFLQFAIQGSLIYFIPKIPDKEKVHVTSTVYLTAISCIFGIIIILISKKIIIANTSYDFILPLILYIIFSLNMSFLEGYFLGKKIVIFLLYYSLIYTFLRITAVLSTAYFTKRIEPIIFALISVEIVRCCFVFIFSVYNKMLGLKPSIKNMIDQIKYFAPLGVGGVLLYFNQEVGKIMISARFGVESLAIYAIGSYQIPIINIVRSSIVDAIFPEIVEKSNKNNFKSLELWQKSNIIYCIFFFPLFIILFFYSEIFINTLFTNNYAGSIPVFRIFLFLIIIRAFEMTVPLRAINKTSFFLIGGVIRLILNIILIFLLSRYIGVIGPAIALVVSGYFMNIFLGLTVCKIYLIKIRHLLMWKKIFKVAASAFAALPLLFVGDTIFINDIIRAIIFTVLYIVIFCGLLYLAKINEFMLLVNRVKAFLPYERRK